MMNTGFVVVLSIAVVTLFILWVREEIYAYRRAKALARIKSMMQ